MLKSISWQEYFVFISVIFILYYALVLIFYRSNVACLWKVRRIGFSLDKKFHPAPENVKQILQEIGPSFRGKQNVHELIYDLQIKLKPYKFMDEPNAKDRINAFIITESEKQCSIHLSEEDLRVLWL